MKKKKFIQGVYPVRNPDKYLGDPDKVIFRSSWELEAFRFLDNNKNVLKWASEEIPIKYRKPTDNNKIHTYWPDLYVIYKNIHGEICKELIEIKPHSQTKRSRSKNYKRNLYENITYSVNQAKWKYAKDFCDKHGIKFYVMTEKQLFRGKK